MTTTGAAIEAESFRILADRVDLSHFDRVARLVVARVIHASADLDYASTMVVDDAAVRAGIDALAAGAPVVTDVEMTRHGISGVASTCYLAQAVAADGVTRSAAGIRAAAERHPNGAIVIVGCAPTALAEVVRLHRAGAFDPALVIGLPVGFVGAAEAKQSLRSTRLAAISNVGEKGGSAVAAAALNAIVRCAADA
ncbi:MAG: precorrin-8X methylmutase [Actinomycetota bacterium]|nr:precorrin-8X methylmutase [Actinomycetota bacterium]